MPTWSCSKYLSFLHSIRLDYLTGKKSGKYHKDSQSQAIPFVAVDLFMHGSKLSEFIQSDVPSNTLLLIPKEFWTVFELGVQRLETLEEIEIQYSQALAKPERETNSHNKLLEALTFKSTRIRHSVLTFIYHCNPLYRNINFTTLLVHRTTLHMWRWFHGLLFLILTRHTIHGSDKQFRTTSYLLGPWGTES